MVPHQPLSQKKRNINNTFVFVFHHCIQHDKISGYTFIIKLFSQSNLIDKYSYSSSKRAFLLLSDSDFSVLRQNNFCRKTFQKFLCQILKIVNYPLYSLDPLLMKDQKQPREVFFKKRCS